MPQANGRNACQRLHAAKRDKLGQQLGSPSAPFPDLGGRVDAEESQIRNITTAHSLRCLVVSMAEAGWRARDAAGGQGEEWEGAVRAMQVGESVDGKERRRSGGGSEHERSGGQKEGVKSERPGGVKDPASKRRWPDPEEQTRAL